MTKIKSEKVEHSNGKKTYREFDRRGNETFEYDISTGYKFWREFDERDNVIHAWNNEGYESWYLYDEEGNCISRKSTDGDVFEEVRKYNEQGKLVYKKHNSGREYFWEFDDRGNQIYSKGDGIESFKKYDEENRVVESIVKNNQGWERKAIVTYFPEYSEEQRFVNEKEVEIVRCNYKGNEIYKKQIGTDGQIFEEYHEYDYYDED